MHSKEIKRLLTEAIRNTLDAQSPDKFEAHRYEVTEPDNNNLLISVRDKQGLRFFEVKVKETY